MQVRPGYPKDRTGVPVGAVHLTAECWPYARTGGLGEAVSSLATYQREEGLPSLVMMPLYRQAREAAGELEAVSEPYPVQVGPHVEMAQLFRDRRAAAHGPDLLFVDHPGFFDRPSLYGEAGEYPDNARRFAFFVLAVLAGLPRVAQRPVILHAHDWHTALALVYLRTAYRDHPFYRGVSAILSVHNAGYQGHFPASTIPEVGLPWELYHWEALEWHDRVNWLKGGLLFADAILTVSPNHARELLSPEGGFGLEDTFRTRRNRLAGILNGIDYKIWDPATDPHIAAPFKPTELSGKRACKAELQHRFGLAQRPDLPVFAMAARLVAQKGLDLVIGGHPFGAAEAQWVFLGQGDDRYVRPLEALAARYPDRVAVETGFTDELEHVVVAGADMLLMPCRYEPCGLTQMRAQRYGTLPVARRVGGLTDTIQDGVTGFLFDEFTEEALGHAVARAVWHYRQPVHWTAQVRMAMGRDFSWERSARRYLVVYRQVIAMRK